MFGKYGLPAENLAQYANGWTASAEDSEYEAINAVTPTSRRPARLTTFDGYWEYAFASPITVGAVHIVYPNFDDGLDVTLEPDGGTPITIDILSPWENFWWISPIQEFAAQTSDTWRLSINSANTVRPQIQQLLLYEELHQMVNDVRWGVVEEEEQGDIIHETDGGAMNVAEVWGPRRSCSGEFALKNTEANELIRLHRSTKQRIKPWTLWPDTDNNDGMWVRFVDPMWARTREITDHNIHPFRVKEVARGLPWP